MNKKCRGCGATLQSNEIQKEGYTIDIAHPYCNRCFRLKYYSEYQKIEKKQSDYLSIVKKIDQTGDLVVLVADVFLLSKQVLLLKKYLKNPVLLVLTKRDILPRSIRESKIKEYIKNMGIPYIDIELISSYKNDHLDELFEKINTYKKSKFVYMVGYTNAGKSTLINKILYNYAMEISDVMTSIMPSTTLDCIEVTIDETLTLIDTPGLLLEKSFMNEVNGKMLSKIMPQKEIKPITYQVKGKQYIYIEDFLEIEVLDNNVTFYISNALIIERYYKKKKNLSYEINLFVGEGEEIMIEGLGFITCSSKGSFIFRCAYDVSIYTRKSLLMKI